MRLGHIIVFVSSLLTVFLLFTAADFQLMLVQFFCQNNCPVAIVEGQYPFPSRTRKSSPLTPMILLFSGKVGSCRAFFYFKLLSLNVPSICFYCFFLRTPACIFLDGKEFRLYAEGCYSQGTGNNFYFDS